MYKSYVENADTTICKICNNVYQYLGSHIWHKHKIKSKQYKSMFNLDYALPLMDSIVRKKKQVAFNKHRKKYLKNLDKSGKYRFKKGQQARNYFSKQSAIRFAKNINKSNLEGLCPVCKMFYHHLYNHLLIAHKLVYVGKWKTKN